MPSFRRRHRPQTEPGPDAARWTLLTVLGALTVVVTFLTGLTLDFGAPLVPQLVRFVYLPFLAPIFIGLAVGRRSAPALPEPPPPPRALPSDQPSFTPLTRARLQEFSDNIAANKAAAEAAHAAAEDAEDRLYDLHIKSVLAAFQPPPGRPGRSARPGGPAPRRPHLRTAAPPPPRPEPLDADELAILDADGDGRPDTPVICAVCGDPVEGDGIPCSLCGIPQHADCWAFAGRCATYACEGRPAR